MPARTSRVARSMAQPDWYPGRENRRDFGPFGFNVSAAVGAGRKRISPAPVLGREAASRSSRTSTKVAPRRRKGSAAPTQRSRTSRGISGDRESSVLQTISGPTPSGSPGVIAISMGFKGLRRDGWMPAVPAGPATGGSGARIPRRPGDCGSLRAPPPAGSHPLPRCPRASNSRAARYTARKTAAR